MIRQEECFKYTLKKRNDPNSVIYTDAVTHCTLQDTHLIEISICSAYSVHARNPRHRFYGSVTRLDQCLTLNISEDKSYC